jgi:hypothetical protein
MIIPYKITHAGNMAMQQEAFVLPIDVAKDVAAKLDCRVGQYWNTHLLKPLRRAIRAKSAVVIIYAAGFSTSDIFDSLAALGHTAVGA